MGGRNLCSFLVATKMKCRGFLANCYQRGFLLGCRNHDLLSLLITKQVAEASSCPQMQRISQKVPDQMRYEVEFEALIPCKPKTFGENSVVLLVHTNDIYNIRRKNRAGSPISLITGDDAYP